MNYKTIYDNLIERGKSRLLEGYVERHHIVPRCMNGTNDISNLVALTPEEHYIAHLLLVKIFPNNAKLVFAANMMCNRNNKQYGWVKRKFALEIAEYNTGYQHTVEARQKMSESHFGVPKSSKHKANIGNAHLNDIEYNDTTYRGWDELKENTGVTRHLYLKYYVNGIDPVPFINNNTYAMVDRVKSSPPRASLGKKWYNNGTECKYFFLGKQPTGWKLGRLKRNKPNEE